MAQVVIYGHRDSLRARKVALSEAIHSAIMVALDYPAEKRFQRFIGLDDDDFLHPPDRGEDYTVIEISMFEGRSERAKRRLIQELFDRIEQTTRTPPHSVEITLSETPKVNWGIRGANAVDLTLGYTTEL